MSGKEALNEQLRGGKVIKNISEYETLKLRLSTVLFLHDQNGKKKKESHDLGTNCLDYSSVLRRDIKHWLE